MRCFLRTGLTSWWRSRRSWLSPRPSPDTDDQSRAIGDLVAARIADGATIQAGIGSVPDAVLGSLRGRRGLRVWSEMISDGILGLERAGALDHAAPIATSFLFGSPELYSWADANPRLLMVGTQVANDPARIAACPRMVSVNSALQVDLFAQANAAYVRRRVYSGFGGQSDFVVGALHSEQGQAIIALRSWHPKANCSTVVPSWGSRSPRSSTPRSSPSTARPSSSVAASPSKRSH